MFVEELDDDARSKIFESFLLETKTALKSVFGRSEHEAQDLISALCRRFEDAPVREQNFLLHDDPVALASILAEVPWGKVDAQRLDTFNRLRRQSSLGKL